MFMRTILFSSLLIVIASCTSVTVRPIDPSLALKKVCIKENTAVKVSDFLGVLRDGFDRHGIATEVFVGNTPESCEYILTYTESGSGTVTQYQVDIRELGITNYSIKSLDEGIDLEGKYSRFELIENVAIPFEVEVTNKVENQKIAIDYNNIVINDRSLYVNFLLPDDVTIIEW